MVSYNKSKYVHKKESGRGDVRKKNKYEEWETTKVNEEERKGRERLNKVTEKWIPKQQHHHEMNCHSNRSPFIPFPLSMSVYREGERMFVHTYMYTCTQSYPPMKNPFHTSHTCPHTHYNPRQKQIILSHYATLDCQLHLGFEQPRLTDPRCIAPLPPSQVSTIPMVLKASRLYIS